MTIFDVTQKALNHLRFLYLFLFFSLILSIIYNYEKHNFIIIKLYRKYNDVTT